MPNAKLHRDFKCVTSQQELLFRLSCKFNPQFCTYFPVAQLVKNLPTMWETYARSLGWESPWRRELLPTAIFWPREFHGLYGPWGLKESDMTERLSLSLFHFPVITFKRLFLYSPCKDYRAPTLKD